MKYYIYYLTFVKWITEVSFWLEINFNIAPFTFLNLRRVLHSTIKFSTPYEAYVIDEYEWITRHQYEYKKLTIMFLQIP